MQNLPLVALLLCTSTLLQIFISKLSYAEPSSISVQKNTQAPLILGIFPRRDKILTVKLFAPLAQYLSEKLDREVTVDTSENFTTFWEKVTQKNYDIVHYNQLHYILSHDWYDYYVILKNGEFGESTIAGSILVRKDSGITSVQQLKNKRIVFGGGSMAMQSYIIASHLLQQAGLKKGDYIEAFSKNPPSAIFSAYNRESIAAGAGDKILHLGVVANKIDTTSMRFLLRGKQLPHLPWAVQRSLPEKLKNEIQSLLSSLNTHSFGRKLLKKARLTALVTATDAEYDQHRTIIEELYGK